MTEGTFHYRPEPFGKRVIAWFLLFSFFLQCAPVAAWALPDPQPVYPRQTLMPAGVTPRLPNPLAGIPDLPQQDMLAADFPEPESTPTLEPDATPTPQATETPQPRRFRVTPENLRAREQKRLEAEALAEKESHAKKNSDSGDASAHDGQDSDSHSGDSPSTPAPSSSATPESEEPGPDEQEPSLPSQNEIPALKKTVQMAVVYAPSRLPGEPQAEISRLPHPASVYSALSATNVAHLQDHAIVFKKTYTNLANPGRTSVWWDFYSPNVENNKTHRRTSASIEFSYKSLASRACHRDASYQVEIRLYDNNHPGGKTLPTLQKSKTHLEELVAYAGIVAPDSGTWHWIERRDGAQLSDTTFEVKRLGGAPAAWTRRIGDLLDPILIPFVAHTSDDWTIRSKEYTFQSFDDGPTAAVYHFDSEWNWFAPKQSSYGDRRPYLKVKTDYYSNGLRYRLLVRAYDRAYPKGRIVRLQEDDGWLPEANITYGVGLPVAGSWRLQEKIGGVETECLTLQTRQISVGVESPNVVWLDNQSTAYRLNLFSGPSSYKVKNFKWTLELRNPTTQALVRSYTGEVSGNTQNALTWEQIWDGKDQDGNPVALGSSVTAQMSVEVPKDPDEAAATFDETMDQFCREIHDVPQRQLAPSRFHHQNKHDAYHPGQPQTVAAQGGQGPAGGGGGSSSAGRRFFYLTGFDQTKGPAHTAQMALYLPTSDAELRRPAAGNVVFLSAGAPLVRVEEQPIRIETPTGNPPQYVRIEFRDGTPVLVTPEGIPIQGYACGDWADMYLRASDGTYSQKVFPSKSDYTNYYQRPPFPPGICVVLMWTTLQIAAVPPPQATAHSPVSQPAPIASASGFLLAGNRMGTDAVGLDVSSGLYSHSETDLALETRGIPALLTRHWHSAGDGLSGGMIRPNNQPNEFRAQFGWIWNFQRELNFEANGTECKLVKPEGGEDAFALNPSSGLWEPSRLDMTDHLTQLDAYNFQIETKSHYFYKFRLPDQVQHTVLGARAFLVQERDMHNNQLNYDWDAAGIRLHKILEGGATNRTLMTLDWGIGSSGAPDTWQQLRSVTDFTGRTVTYTYQQAPVPFQHRAFLSKVLQPGGVTLTYKYNAEAKQKAQPGALNVPALLIGTDPIRLAFYQNLAQYDLTVSLHEVLRNDVSQSVFANADPAGRLLRETNRQTLMTYRRQTTSPVAQIRMLAIPTASPNDTRAVDYAFNSQGRPTEIWDTQGRRQQFTFDAAANLRHYVDKLNQESNFIFDNHRNLVESRDVLGHTYKFTFDSRDRLTEVKNPLLKTVKCTYNNLDELTLIEDESTSPTTFTYTPDGRILTRRNALGHTWSYQYNNIFGFLSQVTEPASSDGIQPVWGFVTDRLGRVTAETSQGEVLSRTTYDVRDRVTSTTLLVTNVSNTRVPNSRTMTYTYNNFDQIVTSKNPLSQVTTVLYDPFQRYIKTVRPDGTIIGRTYDAQGDPVTQFNGIGYSTTYQFDSMHRIVRMVHPQGGGEESFAYDQRGQLVRWRKLDGTLVEYFFDQLKRISSIRHQNLEKLRYTYDPLNRVETMNDEVGGARYTYNDSSDVTEVIRGNGRRILYGFDTAHQLISRTDPEGLVTTFTRNERGQVRRASYDGLTCDYRFNAHGEVTQALWNNGLLENYGYSSQGEPLDRNVNYPGHVLESEAINRDGLSRKTQVAFTLPAAVRTHTYTYNVMGELTGSTRRFQPTAGGAAVTKAYGYDHNSNRIHNDNQNSTYAPSDRIASISGALSPVYDGAGSVQRDQVGANYTYNWRDQLTSYNHNATTAQYAHDGNNLRTEKVVNGVSTSYLWDGADVLKEYNGGAVKASYFLGATGRQAIKTGGVWYIYLRDTHGSVTGLVDLAGNRVATYEADPYGEPIVDQGAIYNPYRWNGEQTDAESGLTYMRNRYYQPTTGRFIQRDPISYAGGLNLYNFAGSDPINEADPTGLRPRRRVRTGRRGSMATTRTIEFNLEVEMSRDRWSSWFGSASFNPEQHDLFTGASELYRQGFFFSPEAGQSSQPNPKTARILRFEKVITPGNSVEVFYDPGTPKRGNFPSDRSPHWKIRNNGQYFSNWGRRVDQNTAAAHPSAKATSLFPPLLLKGDPALEDYKMPRFENPREEYHTIEPYEPEEI